MILRNKNLEPIIHVDNSQFHEKVIRLKKIKLTNDSIIPLSSLEKFSMEKFLLKIKK